MSRLNLLCRLILLTFLIPPHFDRSLSLALDRVLVELEEACHG